MMQRQRVSLRENQLAAQPATPMPNRRRKSPAAAQVATRSGRIAKTQPANNQDWGMPITNCVAATRLMNTSLSTAATGTVTSAAKRTTAPRNFLPRVARLGPKNTAGLGMTSSTATRPPSSQVNDACPEALTTDKRRIKLAKAIRLSDQQNKSYVYLCKPVKKVKELLTARRINDSSEEDKWQRIQLCSAYCQTTDSLANDAKVAYTQPTVERTDSDEYALAPLLELSTTSMTNLCTSSSAISLGTYKPHEQQSDQNSLERSFHSLLQNQLLDIRQRESMLKSALSIIDSSEEQHSAMLPQQRTVAFRQHDIDQVFQNIPTLQREISLLQEIGEKLEATLRCRSGMCSGNCCQRTPSVYYMPRQTIAAYSYDVVSLTRIGFRRVVFFPRVLQYATRMSQLRLQGCIQEFRIETKTLTELKTEDDTQCFYLPVSGSHSARLQRMTFRKLKQNPAVLLQQLRPKRSCRSFNLLDHDPMFFNSVALREPLLASELLALEAGDYRRATSAQPFTRLTKQQSSESEMQLCSSCEAIVNIEQVPDSSAGSSSDLSLMPLCSSCCRLYGGSHSSALDRLIKEQCYLSMLSPSEPQHASPVKCKPKQPARLSGGGRVLKEPQQGTKKQQQQKKPPKKLQGNATLRNKAKEQRQMAPVRCQQQQHTQERPKLQLFKTVLVGMVQISVFLLLIMAFTYPDVRC